jgi:hypothetical protein
MADRHPVFNGDFPGALTAGLLLVAVAVAWPWFYLHGVAKWAVGIPWTLVAGPIVIAVVVSKINAKSAPAKLPTPQPSTRTASKTWVASTSPSGARYMAKVKALTPSGIEVTQSRCCNEGHVTPDQAAAHAARIKSRIETTGR